MCVYDGIDRGTNIMIARAAKFYIVVVGMILTVGLCLPMLPTIANSTYSTTETKPAIVTISGTIRKIEIEGTCYQLATDSGKKYELMGKFPKRDGMKIQVRGIVTKDVATICQVGQPFKVKSYRNIK
jgi:hypothetical protein